IDDGDTEGLLDLVQNSSMTEADLRNILLSKSPYLSDTVLKAYFARIATPVGILTSVHTANRPVSPSVWDVIIGRGFGPSSQQDTLDAHQSLDAISKRDELIGEWATAKFELGYIYSEKISYFLRDTL